MANNYQQLCWETLFSGKTHFYDLNNWTVHQDLKSGNKGIENKPVHLKMTGSFQQFCLAVLGKVTFKSNVL